MATRIRERRIRRPFQAWFDVTPHREAARKWTVRILIGWILQVVLGTILGRLGIVSQILSPAAGAKQVLFGLAAVLLMLLRILVLVFGPPMLAFVWVRAILSRPEPSELSATAGNV
jgi:hypothetical protein